jgi:hypothetical protein
VLNKSNYQSKPRQNLSIAWQYNAHSSAVQWDNISVLTNLSSFLTHVLRLMRLQILWNGLLGFHLRSQHLYSRSTVAQVVNPLQMARVNSIFRHYFRDSYIKQIKAGSNTAMWHFSSRLTTLPSDSSSKVSQEYCFNIVFRHKSRNISIGIAIRLRAAWLKLRSSIPRRGRIFFSTS